MNSDHNTHRWVGCPIRIPTDQSLLAAPHGFSQRATSFIASWCQGIHRMPFLHSTTRTGTTHTGMGRYFYCVGRLTRLSALPVLTARRPLRSGSRKSRHATQHSEVSAHPASLTECGTKPVITWSSQAHTLFSRAPGHHHSLGSDTQPRPRTGTHQPLHTDKEQNTSDKPDPYPRTRR